MFRALNSIGASMPCILRWLPVAVCAPVLLAAAGDPAPVARVSETNAVVATNLVWRVLRGAHLVEERYFDGDSFHLKPAQGREGIFRLYFADCPETDRSLKDRIAAQAKTFKIPGSRIPAMGRKAAEFTREFLRDGCTVHTKMEVAEGNSRMTRHYALIEARGRWLHEALIEAGLARAYGMSIDLPSGPSARSHWRHLHKLQDEAREHGAGVWGDGAPRVAPAATSPNR